MQYVSEHLQEVDMKKMHTTAEELRFLESLGTNSEAGKNLGQHELVRRYKEAMPRRKEWGEISPAQIKQWIKATL